MKVFIFDVGDGASALVVSPNGYGMMIDCGSDGSHSLPISDIINDAANIGIVPFNGHLLTLLHITHPDLDHVSQAESVHRYMPPYFVMKRLHEEFDDGATVHQYYKENLDRNYRTSGLSQPNWGFDVNEVYRIPMEVIKANPSLNAKQRNNSSILRYIRHRGFSILFSGDLETPGWNWLITNDAAFRSRLSEGLTVLIAPHHGHNSGFPTGLFNLTGNVQTVIHSKAREENRVIAGTDVSPLYSRYTNGVIYSDRLNQRATGRILTTRSNGHILIETLPTDQFTIKTMRLAGRHTRVY